MSSKPTIDRSPGSCSPASCAAQSAPIAIRSLQTNTALGRTGARQQRLHGLVAARAGEVASHHVALPAGETGGGQRPLPARAALGAGREIGRSADAGNEGVAQSEQMAGRQLAAGRVVDFDEVAVETGHFAVNEDQGQVQRFKALAELGIFAGRDEDQPVDAFLGEHPQVGGLARQLAVRIAQDQVVSGRETAVLDPADDLGEIGVGVVRDDHPQRAGAVLLEAARDRAGHVGEIAHRGLHAQPGVVADEAGAVQRVRDGGDRNARSLRDILDIGHFLCLLGWARRCGGCAVRAPCRGPPRR